MHEQYDQGSEIVDSETSYIETERPLATIPVAYLVPATGADVSGPAVTWEDAVKVFLASGVDSAGTRRAYARHLRRAGEIFGWLPVAQITGVDLASYRASVLESGLAPSTQGQSLSALRSFLGWVGSLGGHDLPSESIRAALRIPKATVKTRYAVITEKEIGLMFAAAGARERALLGVMLGAGLRVAEAAALSVCDIIEDQDGDVSLFVVLGKGMKDRVVPIRPEVDALLRVYLVESGRHLGDEGRLFLAYDRGARKRRTAGVTTRTLCRLITELAQRAGISAKRVTPHSLRHTYALRCLRAGGNVVAVAKLLGHSSISTTQLYVDHLATSELRSSVAALPFLSAGDELAS